MSSIHNPRDGYVDKVLTRMTRRRPTSVNLIAERICNVVPVKELSGKFWKIYPGGLRLETQDEIAPGEDSNRVAIDWTSSTYVLTERGLHADVASISADVADSALQLRAESMDTVKEQVLLHQEYRAASILFSATYMTNTGAATDNWDDATRTDTWIFEDLINAKRAVTVAGGAPPDHVAMGDYDWSSVAKHLLSQANAAAGVNWSSVRALLNANPYEYPASICGLTLVVGNSVYSSEIHPGDITESTSGLTDIWVDKALVYRKGTGGLRSQQLAAIFRQRDYPRARRGIYPGPREAEWVEYRDCCSDPTVIHAGNAYLITDTKA